MSNVIDKLQYMSNILDAEILNEFVLESRTLGVQLQEILDRSEGDLALAKNLNDYGQYVDRIMGGAKSLALAINDPSHPISKIADYAAVCKAVGYKTSQITDNEDFYNICIALLMDATDVLMEMIDFVEEDKKVDLKEVISQTLVDRVKWVSDKFSKDIRGSVAIKKEAGPGRLNQSEIDDLMAKLGFA